MVSYLESGNIQNSVNYPNCDMGYCAQNVLNHKYLYEVSVVPYRPAIMKTTTFSIKDLRKTLSQYVMPQTFANGTSNIQ